MEPDRKRKNARPECSVKGCSSPNAAKGLCDTHYRRQKKYGSTDLPPREARPAVERPDRACAHCGIDIPKDRRLRGPISYCSRTCKDRAHRESGGAAEANLRHYYRSRYGLTIEEAEAMRAAGCWICGMKDTEANGRHSKLHIDHDHKTGLVRGVLCTNCNTGIGKFNDDPVLLQRALECVSGSLTLTGAAV